MRTYTELIGRAVLNQGLIVFRDVGGAKESGGLISVDVRGLADAIGIAFARCLLPFNVPARWTSACLRRYAPIADSHMIPIMRQACGSWSGERDMVGTLE
jgi:hypothetical protein